MGVGAPRVERGTVVAKSTHYCPRCQEPLVLSSETVTAAEFEQTLRHHEQVGCEEVREPTPA